MVRRTEYLWLNTAETKMEIIDRKDEYSVSFGCVLDISWSITYQH